MNKSIFFLFIIGLIFVFGCNQKIKQASLETTSKIESSLTENVPTVSVSKSTESTSLKLATLPSPQEIQQALKNANLYQGKIDGNIGPKAKRSIKEFQIRNNLNADGKVGLKTWDKLKVYLKPQEGISSKNKEIKD
ncbi:MAG: peptidoglycan-binding domain-containing protein [Candidatus Omnitrophica bacterium]|nr:peptidoglycan-binding domain-containing protein [Candidatus Omnitrophota bacterium]